MYKGYRIRDNRGMYWRWYDHTHHGMYGVWGRADAATVVLDKKALNSMVRDAFRTIRKEGEKFAQLILATGLTVEEVDVSVTITRSVPLPARVGDSGTMYADLSYRKELT